MATTNDAILTGLLEQRDMLAAMGQHLHHLEAILRRLVDTDKDRYDVLARRLRELEELVSDTPRPPSLRLR